MNLLKKNLKAIIAGITTGVFASLAGVWVFSMLFHPETKFYVTLLPKSITTAIGMGISEELGGIGGDYSYCDRNYRDYWKYVCRGNL